jgi:hypothetical protein
LFIATTKGMMASPTSSTITTVTICGKETTTTTLSTTMNKMLLTSSSTSRPVTVAQLVEHSIIDPDVKGLNPASVRQYVDNGRGIVQEQQEFQHQQQ